jgi:hypothetical protein
MEQLTPLSGHTASPALAPDATLTDEEAAALQIRLMPLLAGQMKKKTQGDSASMREEEAAELLASVEYTLRCQLTADRLLERALLTDDLPALFAAGQKTVLDLLAKAKALYDALLPQMRLYGSRSLADTLRGIGGFFARYDARLYAHQIPADIDYQLCIPVPDEPAGVLWVLAYLTRLGIENALLARMDEARVVRLLRRVHPDYGALLINLYEPVAACVIGGALLGTGETLLEISPAQGERIRESIGGMPREAALRTLEAAARAACARLGLIGEAEQAYLAAAARALLPRLTASAEAYRGVFAVKAAPDSGDVSF